MSSRHLEQLGVDISTKRFSVEDIIAVVETELREREEQQVIAFDHAARNAAKRLIAGLAELKGDLVMKVFDFLYHKLSPLVNIADGGRCRWRLPVAL